MKTIITVMVLYWFIAGNIVYADKPVVQNEEGMQENTEQYQKAFHNIFEPSYHEIVLLLSTMFFSGDLDNYSFLPELLSNMQEKEKDVKILIEQNQYIKPEQKQLLSKTIDEFIRTKGLDPEDFREIYHFYAKEQGNQ